MKPRTVGHIIAASLIAIAIAAKVTLDIGDKLRAGREAYLVRAGQHWDKLSKVDHPRFGFVFLVLIFGLGFLVYELLSHGIGFLLSRGSRPKESQN